MTCTDELFTLTRIATSYINSNNGLMNDERKLKLVYGFIRIEISFLNVPSDIRSMLNAFLIFSDEWDASCKGEDIEVDTRDRTISLTTYRSNTIYGKSIIDRAAGVQIWKLTAVKVPAPRSMVLVVGVINDEFVGDHLQSLEWCIKGDGYGFITTGRKITKKPEGGFLNQLYGEKFMIQSCQCQNEYKIQQQNITLQQQY